VILGTSLISGWAANSFCTDATGSGIPQLKAAFWKNSVFAVGVVMGEMSSRPRCKSGRLQPGPGRSQRATGGHGASLMAGVAGETPEKHPAGGRTGAGRRFGAAFHTPLGRL